MRSDLHVGLPQMAVQLDVVRDLHRLGPHKLEQGDGDPGVPGGDTGLGLLQAPPEALQVGGLGDVQQRVGQLVVEHGVVLGLDLAALLIRHQPLCDQLVRVGVRDALPGAGRVDRVTSSAFGLAWFFCTLLEQLQEKRSEEVLETTIQK